MIMTITMMTGDRDDQDPARGPPDHHVLLEPRRSAGHGSAALPLPRPVLRKKPFFNHQYVLYFIISYILNNKI